MRWVASGVPNAASGARTWAAVGLATSMLRTFGIGRSQLEMEISRNVHSSAPLCLQRWIG